MKWLYLLMSHCMLGWWPLWSNDAAPHFLDNQFGHCLTTALSAVCSSPMWRTTKVCQVVADGHWGLLSLVTLLSKCEISIHCVVLKIDGISRSRSSRGRGKIVPSSSALSLLHQASDKLLLESSVFQFTSKEPCAQPGSWPQLYLLDWKTSWWFFSLWLG